jgi:hypothetical protein
VANGGGKKKVSRIEAKGKKEIIKKKKNAGN